MDQYSNTILHLPDYQVTSEATIEEQHTMIGPKNNASIRFTSLLPYPDEISFV